MTDTDPEDYAEQLLAESREELARADGKASILFGAFGVAAGVLLGAVVGGTWSPANFDNGTAECVWWVGIVGAGLSILLLGLAVLPRVRHGAGRERLYYFGHVVQYRQRTWLGFPRRGLAPTDEFLRDLRHPPTSLDRAADQIWVISGLVQTKYRLIRLALASQAAGVGLVLFAALLDR
jgi:MFS family permease